MTFKIKSIIIKEKFSTMLQNKMAVNGAEYSRYLSASPNITKGLNEVNIKLINELKVINLQKFKNPFSAISNKSGSIKKIIGNESISIVGEIL